MLVSDLINNALSLINANAAGRTPAAEDQALALSFCNLHIESLNAAVLKSMAATYDPSLFTFNAVTAFANMGDSVTLPNGWARALQFLTAVDLCPAFERPLGPDLPKLAAEAKAAIVTPATSPASTTT